MASTRRQRRPQGHPAKVAEKRARRGSRPSSEQAQLRRLAVTVCRQAAALETAFDAELWASEVLGMWWEGDLSPFGAEVERDVGPPIVREMARIGDQGGLAGLIALAHVSETELGALALEHAERLTAAGVERPEWAERIEQIEILRAAVIREEVFDDGATILLEAAHPGEERHAVSVYIDNNLGVMVKDVLIAPSIDEVERALRAKQPDDDVELVFEPMDAREAGQRIRAAMELTEMTLDPPVSEDYGRLRSLVLLRTDEIPFVEIEGVPEVDPDERERLLSDLLGSPEASGIAADSDEADVARTAIDFCADYVDGRPLRWSPVVAERFMTWLPRKVIADADYFDAVPTGLEAWIRYAGRRRGVPQWAVERTLEAVEDYAEEMLEDASSGRARGLAGDFIAAAQDAGVDLTDERALASFVAGWNARSERD
jgi:hypothetical protein